MFESPTRTLAPHPRFRVTLPAGGYRAGSTTAQVKLAGRWVSEDMPVRYAECVLANGAGEDRFTRLDAMRRKPGPSHGRVLQKTWYN